jgi:hypothetical protein
MADATDPITAVANAISAGLNGAVPFALDALAQKYNEEHKERIKEFQIIMALPDGPERASRFADFIVQLAEASGQSIVIQGDNDISVPFSVFSFLINCCSDGIRKDTILAQLIKK